MNITQRADLQEDSPERENVVYKLAQQRAKEDSNYQPIRLELTNRAIGRFGMGGHDGFQLRITDVVEGGRSRTWRELLIVDQFQQFIDHPDYSGLTRVIPKTKQNLALLASHFAQNPWYIHEDDIRKEVEALSKELTNIEVKRKEKEAKQLAQQTALPPSPAKGPKSENPDDEPDDDDIELEDDLEQAKERVYSQHAVEIQKMRRSGIKRVDMTKEFREWLAEEVKPG